MKSVYYVFLMLSLLVVSPAFADDSLSLDDVITIADLLDEENLLSSCSLSMPAGGNGVTCSCSGTTCTTTGSGNQLVIKCSDSQGSTTCSYSGANCSCTTVAVGGGGKPIDPRPIDPVSIID